MNNSCEDTFREYTQKFCNSVSNLYNRVFECCSKITRCDRNYNDHIDLELGLRTIPEEEYLEMKRRIAELEKTVTYLKLELLKYEKDKLLNEFRTKRKSHQTNYNTQTTQTIKINQSTQTEEPSYILTKRHSTKTRSNSIEDTHVYEHSPIKNNTQNQTSLQQNIQLTVQQKETIKDTAINNHNKTPKITSLVDSCNVVDHSSDNSSMVASIKTKETDSENSADETSSQELSSWDEISTKEDLEHLEDLENLETLSISDNSSSSNSR